MFVEGEERGCRIRVSLKYLDLGEEKEKRRCILDQWFSNRACVRKVKIAFIIARKRNNVVVLFGTLKVQSFMLTKVRDCDLLIVVTSSTFLKRKDMLKEKSS